MALKEKTKTLATRKKKPAPTRSKSRKSLEAVAPKADADKLETPKRDAAEDLLNQVIRLTGLPAQVIRKELHGILEKKGLDPKKLTLDQVRLVVATYLREIMANILERSSPRKDTH